MDETSYHESSTVLKRYVIRPSPKHCRARGSSAPPLGNDVCKRQYLRSIASENSPPSSPQQHLSFAQGEHLRTGCQGLPDHWAFRSFQFPILNFQEFPPNFYFFTITFRDARRTVQKSWGTGSNVGGIIYLPDSNRFNWSAKNYAPPPYSGISESLHGNVSVSFYLVIFDSPAYLNLLCGYFGPHLAFLTTYPPSVYIFYGIKVYKKSIFDHLPPSSCEHSLWTAPYLKFTRFHEIFKTFLISAKKTNENIFFLTSFYEI